MKTLQIIMATVMLLSIQTTLASESTHGDHEKMKKTVQASKDVTLKGELIGLTCFLKHGGKGSKHADCAKACATKGLPIALHSDGKLDQITGAGHDSLVETYKPLLKYMESKVVIKGEVFKKEGVSLLLVKKIKKQ